jgi:hypothetical protein
MGTTDTMIVKELATRYFQYRLDGDFLYSAELTDR